MNADERRWPGNEARSTALLVHSSVFIGVHPWLNKLDPPKADPKSNNNR